MHGLTDRVVLKEWSHKDALMKKTGGYICKTSAEYLDD